MGRTGTFVRRHFEPLVLSIQVLVDLAVVLLACRVGYELREHFAWRAPTDLEAYRELFLLTGAVTLVCFRTFGMYGPIKRRLDVEEFKSIAKSTIMSFLIVHALIVMLRGTINLPEQGIYAVLLELHRIVDLGDGQGDGFWVFSRMTLVAAFFFICAFTTFSRFASFRAIRCLRPFPARTGRALSKRVERER